MICCSGRPNSPAAFIRLSTSASPNIFLRRRRPRAYNSVVSTISIPRIGCCPQPYNILRREDLSVSIADNNERPEELDEAAMEPARRRAVVDLCGGASRGRRGRPLSEAADQDRG